MDDGVQTKTVVVNTDEDIRRAFRREEKKQRKLLKKKLLADEKLATRSIVLEKGQWQFPACGFLSEDNRFYGNIPYVFFSACESHSSFRSRLLKAAKAIGMELTFGSIVGGQPLIFDEDSNTWIQKHKKENL